LADVGNFPALEWLMYEVAESSHCGNHDIFSAPSRRMQVILILSASPKRCQMLKTSLDLWMKATDAEIKSLKKNGTWVEVPIVDAKTRLLPGTWVFKKRKRTPDDTISKYKARYSVRGNLQDSSDQETCTPVVASSTLRLFLIMSITLQWETCTIDFSNAFVQAKLTEPVWIHLPRGFR
jgi:Reverse transcriptase (RNA-dependent DNA polymerase)